MVYTVIRKLPLEAANHRHGHDLEFYYAYRKDHTCHFDRSDAKRREVEKSGHGADKADFSTPSVPPKGGPDSARNDILKFFSTQFYYCFSVFCIPLCGFGDGFFYG